MVDEQRDVAFDGGSPRTGKQILHQLNDRLKMEPGVEYTKFEPSQITPDTVIASFTPQEFLGEPYPAATATLEVWWLPRSVGKDHFTIQWYEQRDTEGEVDDEAMTDPTLPADYTLSCGWHQDDHHSALGEAHFQEEYPDGTTEGYGMTFNDATPRWMLSECLRGFSDRLVTFVSVSMAFQNLDENRRGPNARLPPNSIKRQRTDAFLIFSLTEGGQ